MQLEVPADLSDTPEQLVSRGVLAQAFTMILFGGLVDCVPEAGDYVSERLAGSGPVVFDHGALRTVTGVDCGALPQGQAAFSRILAPLGYREAHQYPMPRLNMLGHSWCHMDHPEHIAQFFISELDVTRFSPAFQFAAATVVGSSKDPITSQAALQLNAIAEQGSLPFDDAAALLPVIVSCFKRQHAAPTTKDYDILLAESEEMAWISTEGNTFNHAADRVDDLEAVAERQRQAGRAVKSTIETSTEGTVRQTALLSAQVSRQFSTPDGGTVSKVVPGSFFEFIWRGRRHDGSGLDLRFDAANAQAIFKMTSTSR